MNESRLNENILPKSMREALPFFSETVVWRETELGRCRGALSHLESFPAQKREEKFWHPNFMASLKGKDVTIKADDDDEDEIIVSTHGATITVRARGESDPLDPYVSGKGRYVVYEQGYRELGFKWAEKMKDIVEPCLRPSKATPPWEKALVYAAND